VIRWTGLWTGILGDLGADVPRERIAARAHNTIVSAICDRVQDMRESCGDRPVVLSGGVFQNRILMGQTTARLAASGCTVLTPKVLPANDGGISLGQATIAAARGLR